MANVAPPRHPVLLPSEAQVQQTIVEGLRLLGYVCLEVGRWRKRTQCPRCGEWFTPRQGMPNTPGTPDLLVTSTRWRGGDMRVWIGLEVKRPGGRSLLGTVQPGRVRPEQRELVEAGLTVVVHSWEEALAAVTRVESE